MVKGNIISMVNDFFQNNSSLKLINHTNIALIPKVENPEIFSNYRPISLCNVSYKIITKIIINRLKPLLNFCISKNQSALSQVSLFKIIFSLLMSYLLVLKTRKDE